MSLDDLERTLPALLNIRSDRFRHVDWVLVEREIGSALPSDFVALAESYPPFTIDEFLGLHIPSPGEEEYFVRGVRTMLRELADLRDAEMSHGNVPFPETGGLLPWGSSAEGDNFYWRTADAGADSWTVLVSSHNDHWYEYRGSLTSYLADKLRGRVSTDGLPPNFPADEPIVEAD